MRPSGDQEPITCDYGERAPTDRHGFAETSPPGGRVLRVRTRPDTESRCAAAIRRLSLIGIAVALIAGAEAASADAGGARPDPAFGGGRGWVTTQIRGASSLAYDAAVIRSGKIVIAGQATNASGKGQVVVARYKRNGRLDRGFGSRGIFRTSLPAKDGPFIATSVVQERSTRRLVVAGGYGQGSMLVLRLTADGRLDRAFGKRRPGLATASAGGIAESVAIQRNGAILVGGSNANANGRPMVVARFTRAGVLDRRFGTGGLAETLFWNPDLTSSAGVTGLAITPDGEIIGSGHLDYIGSDGHGSAGVFRLAANGQPVQGFGSAGHTEVAFTEATGAFAQWFPCAMTVDSAGRITVTGDGSTGSGAALLTARLTSSGAPDPSFGAADDGRVTTQGLRKDSITTCGATISPAGVLTAGVGSNLAQLGPAGAVNEAFAPKGLLRIADPRRVTVNAVGSAGSRRVVVAGAAGRDIYVARYLLPSQP